MMMQAARYSLTEQFFRAVRSYEARGFGLAMAFAGVAGAANAAAAAASDSYMTPLQAAAVGLAGGGGLGIALCPLIGSFLKYERMSGFLAGSVVTATIGTMALAARHLN